MLGAEGNAHGLAQPVLIDQIRGHQIFRAHRLRVANRQRLGLHGRADRSPYLNYREAAADQIIRLVRQKIAHALARRALGVIVMDDRHRLAHGFLLAFAFVLDADGLVEHHHAPGAAGIHYQPFNLGIVDRAQLRLVEEVVDLGFVTTEDEAFAIQVEPVGHGTAVSDGNVVRLEGAGAAHGIVAGLEKICRRLLAGIDEVGQRGVHRLDILSGFRYRRRKPHLEDEQRRQRERMEHAERTFNDLWRTVPKGQDSAEPSEEERELIERKRQLKLPEENLLYFIEKNSPTLNNWERELLRIVRNIAQYFYPQKQTKVMNEGCATFVHHHIINALYEKGLIDEGSMLEFNHMHANVLFQPDFDDPRFSGLNPYALGFAMMEDIKRICSEPTEEDRTWFPEIAGNGDWRGTLRHAWENYRDESFIQQFLSPHLIRKLRLFALSDKEKDAHYLVSDIHDERGFRAVREKLARSYDIGYVEPNIQCVDVDLLGDRHLQLQHTMHDGIPLAEKSRDAVLNDIRRLWGYEVTLTGIDGATDKVLYEASTTAPEETDKDKEKAKAKAKPAF